VFVAIADVKNKKRGNITQRMTLTQGLAAELVQPQPSAWVLGTPPMSLQLYFNSALYYASSAHDIHRMMIYCLDIVKKDHTSSRT
jgi:hypothetical protein